MAKVSIKTKGKIITKKNKKIGNKTLKNNKQIIVKTNNTVIPVSTPVGSVHFDEFLKICKEPKLLEIPIVKNVDEKKNNKSKKPKKGSKTKKRDKPKKSEKSKKRDKKNSKTSKIQTDVKPNVTQPLNEIYPPLFPLIKALLLPTDDDPLKDNTLFSEFVVGKHVSPVVRSLKSMREINLIEQQANDTVDEINKVKEHLKILMEKEKLNEQETIELEDQKLHLMKLLSNFENCLEKIRAILNAEQVTEINTKEVDDSDWVDVDGEYENGIQAVKRHNTCRNRPAEGLRKKRPVIDLNNLGCNFPEKINEIINDESLDFPYSSNCGKWYEGTDLAYLLSPNTSFEKGMSLSVSSGLLRIFNELKGTKDSSRQNVKRNEVFIRLKQKFSILLPPPKLDGTRDNLQWVDKKLYKDHRAMLNATDNLKIFQCWKQLELKYNIINALTISLKDVIRSTSPFYYSSSDVKSQFTIDQNSLVQALDEFKRKINETFLPAGLTDYWKIYPESIRLGSKPCFDVTIRQHSPKIDNIISLDKQNISFLHTNEFITKGKFCKHTTNTMNSTISSADSEIEVDTVNYN